MELENLPLANLSEVLQVVMATEGHSSFQGAMHTFTMAIYIVTFILGVTGNGLVIWAAGFKMKRTANTVWFLGLAVADFTFALLLPFSIAYIKLNFHWPFGLPLCKLSSGAAVLTMYASVLTLAAISVDRCVSVVLPIWAQNHRGPRLASLLSLGVWLAAAALSIPSFAYRDTVDEGNRTVCYVNFLLESELAAFDGVEYGDDDYEEVVRRLSNLETSRHRSVALVRFLGGFLLPFTVISISYAVIWLRLRRNRLATSGKPFKVIAAVIVVFLLCWAPYQVFMLLELTHRDEEVLPSAVRVGIRLSSSLACVNSCVNPILYICMGQDFRDKLKMSLRKALVNAMKEDSAQFSHSGRSRTKSLALVDEASVYV